MNAAKSEQNLRTEVWKLLRRARADGLSQSDVDACLLTAATACLQARRSLAGHSTATAAAGRVKPPRRGQGRQLACLAVRVLCYSVAALVVTALAAFAAVSQSRELGERVGRLLQPFQYEILGLVRNPPLLNVARLLGLSRYYGEQCIVENPLYVEGVSDCWPCRLVSIPDVTDEPEEFVQSYLGHLFVQKGQASVPDAYTALKSMVELYGNLTDETLDVLWSTSSKLTKITDFGRQVTLDDLKTADDGRLHLTWTSRTVSSSRAVRLYFHKPHFLPPETEVSLEKTLLLDGPCSAPVKMPLGHFSYNWYHQLSGSRQLMFWPNIHCLDTCRPLSVVVDAGTIVHYQDQLWTMETRSVTDQCGSNPISLAYVGSFIY